MRKLLLPLFLLLLLPNLSRADVTVVGTTSPFDILADIPAMKQGVAISLADSNVNYLSTVEVKKIGKFSLDVGYAGRAKETGDKMVAMVSYNLIDLRGKTTIPLVDLVNISVGPWVGVGRITGSNELDYGIAATAINLKW